MGFQFFGQGTEVLDVRRRKAGCVRFFAFGPSARTTEIPIMATTTMTLATTMRPEMTAFAALHISARVLAFFLFLEDRDERCRKRPLAEQPAWNRLGIWNAS